MEYRERQPLRVEGAILGSQVSAIGCQVRVFRFGYGCGT